MKSESTQQEYQIHQFPNGIRLIHKQVPSTKIVHCGFILDVGSRDEKPDQQGIAHFWEHMAFKGTQKRKAYHIINRLEILGGELNAYTTKEKIAFHASVLVDHYNKAVDLLTDITFYSTFPQKEMEREKGVILEEMAMYRDSPDDAIQDELDLFLFPDHPIGKNILGTEESIPRFQQTDFQEFFRENVSTERLVFSVVGPLDFKTVVRKSTSFLEKVPKLTRDKTRLVPPDLEPCHHHIPKPISQAHLMLGWRSYPLIHPKRVPMFLLHNILGGPALNSRLNMSIREKQGLAYSVESGYATYQDTGAFSIYLGTELKNLGKAESLIWKELNKMKTSGLTSLQLHNAKEQIKGQLAMAEEGNLSFMLMMGKSLLDLGRVESLGEIFAGIDSITSTDLMEVANEVLNDRFCVLSYVPS